MSPLERIPQAFQRVKPDERKVQLDDRFKAVLTDPRFQVSNGELAACPSEKGLRLCCLSTRGDSLLGRSYIFCRCYKLDVQNDRLPGSMAAAGRADEPHTATKPHSWALVS